MAIKIRFLVVESAHFPFPLLEHARSLPLRHAHTKDLATAGSFPNKSRLSPGANYWKWKDSNPIQAANNGLDLRHSQYNAIGQSLIKKTLIASPHSKHTCNQIPI